MPPKYRIEVTCPKHFYTSLFGKKHAVPVNIRVYENSTKRLATYVHVCVVCLRCGVCCTRSCAQWQRQRCSGIG
jgi:hypothetical protein